MGKGTLWYLALALFWMANASHAETFIAAGRAPPDSPWEEHWFRFMQVIDEAPGLDAEYHIRGELGNDEAVLGALRRNRVQVFGTTCATLAELIPELSVPLAPGIFESNDEADFIFDNYLTEPVKALLEERGLVFLQWVESGWVQIFSNTPILTPSDIRNQRIRGLPNISHLAFLDSVGAEAVLLGMTDTVPAIQTGLIDGGMTNTIFHGFVTAKHAPHFTLTFHQYDPAIEIANKRWFDGLSSEHQKAVKDAVSTPDWIRGAVRSLEARMIDQMRGDGITVHELNEQQKQSWAHYYEQAQRRVVDEAGGRAAEIYQLIMQGKAEYAATRKEHQ